MSPPSGRIPSEAPELAQNFSVAKCVAERFFLRRDDHGDLASKALRAL
ncbi:MAG TPA: hypothetical protein PLR37_04700 [Candidatus Accumulibacter phosphatis]|nr:hypothetical protein [Accumulibacter sp.]HRF11422.1 hypothetical protein [Candidatus Accumulibacter phosphatis]